MSDFVVKNGLQIGGGSSLKSGTIAGNATLDLTSGNFFSHTPTADTTFVFSNPPASGKAHGFALKVTGDEVPTGYDLANASYDSVSFSVAAQGGTPLGLSFKPDGTKMYVFDGGNIVYQYSLSTGFDLSTASYDSITFTTTGISGGSDIAFSADGTRLYAIGFFNDSVIQYDLSTAFDLSTASSSSAGSFSVAAQNDSARGVFFKSDGTKMYVLGIAGSANIYQYTLSTAFDVTTASYDSVSFSVNSQEGTPLGLNFKSDGTKMYVVGFDNATVYQYSLSTGFDLSTASYSSVSFSVATQDSLPTELAFNANGTKLYVIGTTADTIYQYSTAGTPAAATFTYPASVAWPNGVPPTAPADGETDVLTFYTEDGGTTYYGIQRGDNMAPVPPDPMVLVYNTALSAGTTVVLPLAGTVDVTVDWGDGSVEDFTTAGDKTHTYATDGTYTVEMVGTLTGFGSLTATYKDKLIRVTSWGDLEFTLTSLAGAFFFCTNLTEVPATIPSGVTSANYMFGSAAIFNQNIGSWDVSSVTDMTNMFASASTFNQDISSWNVSNVTSMSGMFSNTPFNQNISSWDVSNVTTMRTMFTFTSTFNQNIGSWNVSSVTDMSFMFRFATAMTFPLGSWQTNLAGQPVSFSDNANATFVTFRGTANFPLLADTVTRINT